MKNSHTHGYGLLCRLRCVHEIAEWNMKPNRFAFGTYITVKEVVAIMFICVCVWGGGGV